MDDLPTALTRDLPEEGGKGLDKKVQVNLVRICLVSTTFLFLYASVHVRCNHYRPQQIKGIGNEVTIKRYLQLKL